MMLTQESPPPPTSFEYSPEADSILSFSPMGTVEDFFNFEMLSGGASSSRSSSRSPSASFWNLPQTPPSSMGAVPEVREESSSETFYNGLFGESSKPSDDLYTIFEGTTMPMPIASAPELFGLASSSTSPISPDSVDSPDTAISPSNVFAIDPSLMTNASAIPKTEQTVPHLSSSEDADISSHEDDEDDAQSVTSSNPALKVGGKGSNRKGTVASGGVRKGNGAVMTQAVRRDDEPLDDDDWRPTPEEYKKMSSKEKRQLRNKISARNFRVRRKEYITTLEGDIAQRDTLIDAIRTELGSTKLENQSLRQEVEALKKALLKGGISPNLPPPGPISEEPPASVTNKENAKAKLTARQALLAKPNTQKDLPSSPRMGNAFWGGAKLGGGLGGGVTPVHTTLIPEFAPIIPEKLAARARAPQLQENINPSLNANPFYGIGANSPAQSYTDAQMTKAGFEAFTDLNPFTLKSLDSYRLQLWNRMAIINGQRSLANAQTTSDSVLQQQSSNWQQETLAGQLRPAYFSSPKSPTLVSSILSPKGSTNAEKENSKPGSSQTESKLAATAPTAQQAALATLASQSFAKKLGNAFWDAFTSSSATSSKNWDQEKVRKVLEGKAVVRVVDVGPSTKKEGIDALEESMKTLAIGSQGGRVSPPTERLTLRSEPCFLQNLRTGSSALSGKKA